MSSHRFEGFTSISSGHIDGVRYDSSQRKMFVRFNNGAVYVAHGISADSYQQLINAHSAGEHYHAHIKNSYHIERVK